MPTSSQADTKGPGPPGNPTRSALLEAGRRRFIRFGPRKTTMEEIAREAGLSRATLYTHFKSKKDLYADVLDLDTRQFVARAAVCADAQGDAREKLREIVEIANEAFGNNALLLGAAAGDEEMSLENVATVAMRKHEKQVTGLLTRVLDAGVRSGSLREIDPTAVAYLMYQLGMVLIVREASGRRAFPLRRILGVMDDIINHGITATKPTLQKADDGR